MMSYELRLKYPVNSLKDVKSKDCTARVAIFFKFTEIKV